MRCFPENSGDYDRFWRLIGSRSNESNKKFWGKKLKSARNQFFKQNVEQIEFRIIGEENAIRSSIFSGAIDMCTYVPPQLYFELSDIPKLQKTLKTRKIS